MGELLRSRDPPHRGRELVAKAKLESISIVEAIFSAWERLANASIEYSNEITPENAAALREAAEAYALAAELTQ